MIVIKVMFFIKSKLKRYRYQFLSVLTHVIAIWKANIIKQLLIVIDGIISTWTIDNNLRAVPERIIWQ